MREEIIRMVREAGWTGLYITWAEPTGEPNWTPFKESMTVPVTIEQLERFAELVAAAKKEECAKEAEGITKFIRYQSKEHYKFASVIAAAIRALP